MTPEIIQPPAMLLVRQGWFHWYERGTATATLIRYDRLRTAGKLRGRPWWRGMGVRWKRL